MKGYVFISNSNKPTKEESCSRKPIRLSNVNRPPLSTALKMGYEVWFGVNRSNPESLECELPVHLYDSHTYRSLLNLKDNFIAYKNLMNIIQHNDIEVIHCNTPIGGLVGRWGGVRGKVKKVIYTAHGFHFYKGAPLLNRTLFKWAEMIMARWTDAIITMNYEDYESAKKFKLKKGGQVFFVPGVGINTKEYKDTIVDKEQLRFSLGLKQEDFVCISMGDLIARKNYVTAIKAIAQCQDSTIHYLICGKGPELDNLKQLAKELNIEKQIHFLGFRTDIKELLKIANLFLFTTLQEGLPRSMMEAMASGLPCIASEIRGNVDLLENNKGGFLVSPKNIESISERINYLRAHPDICEEMACNNLQRIKQFDIKEVTKKIEDIYSIVLCTNIDL
ncbi:glycosyltransferase [Gallibacterium anatis]|uniref:glycosyltransferase n=2 Tax=Gallibacterium anatis TaxID=750 RepID=UPI003007A51E